MTRGPQRVLIVDDNADIRRLVRLRLELDGTFDVVPDATDGRSALASAQAFLPDVVLLDLSMPIMDGLEALPMLRQLLPYGRIVMLSGFEADRFRGRAIELGADEYVEKGSALEDLVGLLQRLTMPALAQVPSPRAEAEMGESSAGDSGDPRDGTDEGLGAAAQGPHASGAA